MIICADIHLGKVQDTIPKNGLPSRAFDVKVRLKEAVDMACLYKESLVVAGDVFDSTTPSPWMIDILFEVLVHAEKQEVSVVILPGNHDCGVQFNSMQYIKRLGLENVTFIEAPAKMLIDDAEVLVLPHVTRQRMEEMVQKHDSYAGYVQHYLNKHSIKKVDMIIGHAHVTGAKNASEIEIEAGDALHFDTGDYPPFTRAVFGHIHLPQRLKKDKILYTGPVVTNSFDEAEIPKGVVRVWNKGEEFEFLKFVTYVTEYKHVVIDLVSKDELVLDDAKVKALVGGMLVKLSVYARDPMQVDMQMIRSKFDEYGKVVRFETIITQNIAEIDQSIVDDVFEQVDFLKVFKSWLEDKDAPANVKKRALAMAGDVIEEITDAERTVSQ